MSLINDALKKAQRQRAAAEAAVTPPMPGATAGTRPGKHGRAMPAQTVLLIVIGAAVLVVLSVVATVYLLRTPSSPVSTKPATVAATEASPTAASSHSAAEENPSSPVVVLPEIKAPIAAPVTAPIASARVPETKAAPEPTPPAPETTTPPVPDERAYAFIDKLQVMGIRSSGNESKVLMNDRVYRVNDIVERSLGLKLVKVAPDSLTFVDRNGATYTKNF